MTIGSHRIGRPPPKTQNERVASRVRDLETRPEAWVGDTGWQTSSGLSFTNSWADFGSTQPLGFKRDPNGNVWIRGGIKSGTSGAAAFTLPVGYRPELTMTFWAATFGGSGNFAVSAAGVVTPTVSSGTNAVVLLNASWVAYS